MQDGSELKASHKPFSDIQKNESLSAYKRKAKLEALRFAPSSKYLDQGIGTPSNYPSNASMTATEIKDAAEVIYQWLIKDL